MSGAIDLGKDRASKKTSTPTQDAWVLKVLGFTVAQTEAPAGTAQPSLVGLQKSRLAWDTLRKTVQAQLRAIEQSAIAAVEAHNADAEQEDEFDPAEAAAGVAKIYTILEKLDTRLIDKLDQALNAEGEARARYHAEARDIVKDYQKTADGDQLLAKIDLNGFAATKIRDAANATLAALARQL